MQGMLAEPSDEKIACFRVRWTVTSFPNRVKAGAGYATPPSTSRARFARRYLSTSLTSRYR